MNPSMAVISLVAEAEDVLYKTPENDNKDSHMLFSGAEGATFIL